MPTEPLPICEKLLTIANQHQHAETHGTRPMSAPKTLREAAAIIEGLVDAGEATGSALDDWIKLVGIDGKWTRNPTPEEVQEAMRANNELADKLKAARSKP